MALDMSGMAVGVSPKILALKDTEILNYKISKIININIPITFGKLEY